MIDFFKDFPMSKATFRSRLLQWYKEHAIFYPWRKDWEKFASPFHVWISEVMLQQTTITAVLPKYLAFVKRFPHLLAVARSPEEDFQESVQGLGYYRRFRFFYAAAQQLTQGINRPSQIIWPDSYEKWLKVPGIGPYTAAAISSITQNGPHPVVDGNVERVISRLMAWPGPVDTLGYKKRYYEVMHHYLDPSAPGDFNQALMQLGQLVCTPQQPSCDVCPLESKCLAKARSLQSEIPAPKAKKAPLPVELCLLYSRDRSKIAVRRRDERAKFLKSQLGLPTLIFDPKQKCWLLDGVRPIDFRLEEYRTLASYHHSITHHKIHTRLVEYPKAHPLTEDLHFIPYQEAQKSFIASLDLKALKKIAE